MAVNATFCRYVSFIGLHIGAAVSSLIDTRHEKKGTSSIYSDPTSTIFSLRVPEFSSL